MQQKPLPLPLCATLSASAVLYGASISDQALSAPLSSSIISANKLLNTKRDGEKPRPQILCLTPSLLAIKFSHSDQRRRQLAGVVAEPARTMAKNGVAIPSDENDAPTSVSDASNSSTFGNSSTTLDNKTCML